MKLGCMRCLCSMNENILSIVLFHEAVAFNWQKQPSRGVLKIRCSENIQQTYSKFTEYF